MTKRRIAIVPARGGSKRIPKKNIKLFCGKPMLAYVLEAAKESGLFNTIHVSTDSEEVSSVASTLGFLPDFYRSAELADDHTPIMPVLVFVLNEYKSRGIEFDEVCLLMPTAPFIEVDDLHKAAEVFSHHKGRHSVISVAKYPVPIEWAYTMQDNKMLVPENKGAFATRSQDLPEKYYDTGTFVFLSTSSVLGARNVEGDEYSGSDTNFIGYEITKDKAVDIDDMQDWDLAEKLYRGGCQ